MSYKVTEEFLKKFGLNTLEDLPELPKYKFDENQKIVTDDLAEQCKNNIEVNIQTNEEIEPKKD